MAGPRASESGKSLEGASVAALAQEYVNVGGLRLRQKRRIGRVQGYETAAPECGISAGDEPERPVPGYGSGWGIMMLQASLVVRTLK